MNIKKLSFLLAFVAVTNCFAASDGLPVHINLRSGINNLISVFDRTFVFADLHGKYIEAYEREFESLFTEEANIQNFIPGSNNYKEYIALPAYINDIRVITQNRIIQPGVSSFRTGSLQSTDSDDIYYVTVFFSNDLVIYSRYFDKLDEFDIHLEMQIRVDVQNEELKIASIGIHEVTHVSLDFFLFSNDNEPAFMIPVEFVYTDPFSDKQVVRKRHADQQGHVKISMIPVDADLMIRVPRVLYFEHEEVLPVADWLGLFESSNSFVIKDRRDNEMAAMSRWLRAGANYTIPVNHHHTLFRDSLFLRSDHRLRVLFSQRYHLVYMNRFYQKNNFSIALGSGIEYNAESILFMTGRVVYPPVDKDTLYIKDVVETYSYRSFAVPVLITYRYHFPDYQLQAIDLTGRFSYYFSKKASYKMSFKYDSLHNNNENGSDGDNQPYNHHIQLLKYETEGDLQQSLIFSAGLQLDFNMALFGGRVFFVPAIGYTVFYIGETRNEASKGNNDNNETFPDPGIIYEKYLTAGFSFGFGLLINL